MNDALKIAVAGLGTVGGGTVKLLLENADLLALRCGRRLELVAVAERDRSRDLGISLDGIEWLTDASQLATRDDVDVVVELIGGSEGIARKLCETALAAGKHVVTANKALLAHHGNALARLAEERGVTLRFEAAVAGGIPIIKALREGLAGNRILHLHGILNGTCNYILTQMRESGRPFEVVLAEAQGLGYAEADPSFDVDGIDAAHKLAILAGVAFGREIAFSSVHVEGIRSVSPIDIEFARELGYRIKLLGIAALTDEGVEQRVHPCMVPVGVPIAQVEGVFNAVVLEGDYVGTTVYEGRGAGERPTASAVVADLADLARGITLPTLGIPVSALQPLVPAPLDHRYGSYYIRLTVLDQPGVFADVAAILRDNRVSMEAILQRGRAPGEAVPVVMTLHQTREADVKAALTAIAALDAVTETPCMIRIEAM